VAVTSHLEDTTTRAVGEPTTTETSETSEASSEEPVRTTIEWLEREFPGWSIDVDQTASWGVGDLRPLWIARRDGHHPQSELSPAKLHTRLTEYLGRERRRRALSN
jgi:hypothetical protein